MKASLKITVSLLALWPSAITLQSASAQTVQESNQGANQTGIAPTPLAASALPAAPSLLSVSLPPQARLRFDIDARDGELLGAVKSLLDGFDAGGENLKSIVPQGTAEAAARDLNTVAFLQLLSDANLNALLRNISHLRAVVFETPRSQRSQRAASSGGATPDPAQSVMGYYEQAYIVREGGHRIMRADFDDVQMLTVGFSQNGFALVLQAPGIGAVVRSDGYPSLESVGPVAMAMFLRFVPSAR